MGLNHSPKIVTDGLVFYTDMNNTEKSFRGPPTTNSVTNANTMAGWTNYYRTTASSTFVTEFGTTGYRFMNQPSWNGIYKSITIPAAGTYTFSARFRYFGGSANNNGATVYISGYGAGDTAVGLDKSKVGVWQNISITINCTNTTFLFYIISYGGTDNGTGNPDFSSWEVTMPQAEAGTFATPFVNGTRTNTQAILDLTKQNTITATSLTYAANGTASFNGTSDVIQCGNDAAINFGTGNFTVSAWFKRDANATTNLRLLSKGGDSDTADRAGFAFYGGDTSVGFIVNPSGVRTIITAATYAVGEWVNVVGLVERGVTMRGYKNGNLVGSAAAPVGSVSGDLSLFIGNNAGSGLYWPGEISQVSLYNRALTAAEIVQNFNAHRGRYGI